jgi:hypothetical protein
MVAFGRGACSLTLFQEEFVMACTWQFDGANNDWVLTAENCPAGMTCKPPPVEGNPGEVVVNTCVPAAAASPDDTASTGPGDGGAGQP